MEAVITTPFIVLLMIFVKSLRYLIPTFLCLLSFCQRADAQTAFVEVTESAGIHHQFIVYEGTFGGGATIFDFNNDGWEDVFLAGGMADDVLYLNKGDGTFENIYESSGLRTDIKYITQGAVSADVNRDGWRDLFVTTITIKDSPEKVPRAINLLYINKGDGTFKNETHAYGLDKYLTFSTGAMFGDVNQDGYPDLYVGNYFQMFEGKLHVMNDAIIVGSQQMAEGLLLINNEGKYFEDQYKAYGLDYKGFGFGGAFSDFDNDYDLDLIINHDFGYRGLPNKLLQNNYPEPQYLDVSDSMNMALPVNGMGTAVGDYNNDGLMDYYITNIRANPFMVNQGRGKPFVNMNNKLGIMINMMRTKEGAYLPVSWGTNFADFDHDTDLDLFVANGCLNPFVLPNADYYFENTGSHFIDKSREKGLADDGIGRGSVVFDYDNDGDQDLLVVNQAPVSDGLPEASPTRLFRNDSSSGNWIRIELAGNEADKNGIGSRIEVIVGDLKMIREVDGGSSHMSQNSTIAHFGLGSSSRVDSINVIWLGGKKQSLTNQKCNQKITIREAGTDNLFFSAYLYILLALLVVMAVLYSVKNAGRKVKKFVVSNIERIYQ
jgi:hypothetical protein